MEYRAKNKLLQWLAGKFGKTSPVPAPITDTYDYYSDDFQPYLSYLQEHYTNYEIIDVISAKYTGNQLSMSVVYGKWGTNKGFILLLNSSGEVIQAIDKFDSGTSFNAWVYIGIAEDGSYYAIDSAKRLLLLNNFTVKSASQSEYSVKIRKSYMIDNTTQAYNGIIKGVKKSPIEAVYLIYGNTTDIASSPFVTKFKIDIAMGNEWSDYTYTNVDRTSEVRDLFVSDWENIYFQIGSIDYDNRYIYTEYSISSETTTMTRTDKLSPIISAQTIAIGQLYIVSQRYTYVALNITALEQYMAVGVIDRLNNTIEVYDVGKYTELPIIRIIDNDVFIFSIHSFPEYPNINYEMRMGMILDDGYRVLRSVYNDEYTVDYNNSFIVNKEYDLYNLFFCRMAQNKTVGLTLIYNPNQYSGQEYYDYNMFIPRIISLSSSRKIEFARNLYNKQINGATITSIVEVPNLNMNNIPIVQSNLYGETDVNLIKHSENFEKNIYETLYYNFIQTYKISNQNNPNDIIYNNDAAIRLNQSISQLADYDNSKSDKYRVNYKNGSSTIFDFSAIIITGNESTVNQILTYVMTIYNSSENPVISIELISNDELTTYQTLTPILETNKIYTITQEVVVS